MGTGDVKVSRGCRGASVDDRGFVSCRRDLVDRRGAHALRPTSSVLLTRFCPARPSGTNSTFPRREGNENGGSSAHDIARTHAQSHDLKLILQSPTICGLACTSLPQMIEKSSGVRSSTHRSR